MLAVPDLQRSAAFYRDVLGFEVRVIGDHSYFAYLVVDDVDGYHRQVVAAGAEIVKPLATEPWGMREFGLRTADGHRIMVGQEMRRG